MAQSFPSSIVPPGGTLVGIRNGQPRFQSMHLEVFEVIFGLCILAFILARQFNALKTKVVAKKQVKQKEDSIQKLPISA